MFRDFLDGKTERNTDPNSSEYPQTCTKECPHTQCSSYGTPEMEGKVCRNRVKTNQQILDETQNSVTQAVERAFKPLNDRLDEIERQINVSDSPPLNGETIPLSRGTNQERIKYVD